MYTWESVRNLCTNVILSKKWHLTRKAISDKSIIQIYKLYNCFVDYLSDRSRWVQRHELDVNASDDGVDRQVVSERQNMTTQTRTKTLTGCWVFW